ncbi:hypothetical protein [Pedobacter steynii]
MSVTIYAKDAITADGYDSPIMAMNVKEALDFIASKRVWKLILFIIVKMGVLQIPLQQDLKK